MTINTIQLHRWYLMVLGKSLEHVNQNIGRVFCKTELKGYYNDLTEKVTFDRCLLRNNNLPLVKQLDGQSIHFPVAIFQYALGCYDLWLLEKDDIYKTKFLQCVSWTLDMQSTDGMWDNFSHVYPEAPYGAMAQGEAASVLLRAYQLTNCSVYLESAKKAIDFMLRDLKRGGTTEYSGDFIIFREYTNQPVVMNGWIFAWWGLYDYVLVTKDDGQYKDILKKSLDSLIKILPCFKNSYWSLYDLDKKLASPFYHNLHIAQMQAMYELTGEEIFKEYSIRWEKQYNNIFCKTLAFVIKAIQKIRE